MTTEELLPRLDHVTKGAHGWTARCPAHDDHDPSLSITTGDDGRILLYCHTGCPADAICTALGISMADLFPDKSTGPRTSAGKLAVAGNGIAHGIYAFCPVVAGFETPQEWSGFRIEMMASFAPVGMLETTLPAP